MGRMFAQPTMRSQEYKWADNDVVCRFTSVTTVNEVRNMDEKQIPLFPPFMRFNKVWEFYMDNDTFVGKCSNFLLCRLHMFFSNQIFNNFFLFECQILLVCLSWSVHLHKLTVTIIERSQLYICFYWMPRMYIYYYIMDFNF